MAEVKTEEPSFEECREEKSIETDPLADVAGGMGRHLGVFSCTMLMYVFIILSDFQSFINIHMPVLVV